MANGYPSFLPFTSSHCSSARRLCSGSRSGSISPNTASISSRVAPVFNAPRKCECSCRAVPSTATAATGDGPRHFAPHPEADEREGIADEQQALKQELLHPQVRHARRPRLPEALLQLRDAPFRQRSGRAHQCDRLCIERAGLPSAHLTFPLSTFPHPFISPALPLPAAPRPSPLACSPWGARAAPVAAVSSPARPTPPPWRAPPRSCDRPRPSARCPGLPA